MMLNIVPFNKNPDEWHCIHAAMQSVIKKFTGDYYSLDYLNALLNPEHDLWVWPLQVVKALDELGLFVRVFTSQDVTKLPDSLSNFPEQYKILTHAKTLKNAVNYVATRGLQEKKNLTLNEIEKALQEGCLPIVILGTKKYMGKYVILTGYDSQNIYYHETGPDKTEPNRAIPKEKFLEKWMEIPSLNTAVMVYGKKQGNGYLKYRLA
ncbi:MAG TPA: hypothetical protein VI790_03985 [Candidatus Nanoarchaeia archaeon]|nr:hypothetical protein [Candidatus Nanoarchaeia archaeon]